MRRARPATTLLALPVLSGWMIAVAGCRPDDVSNPVRDEAVVEQTVQHRAVVAGADLLALEATLEDAVDRLVPALDADASALHIASRLEQLSAALGTGDAVRARDALREVRVALGRVGPTPDVGAIGLVLERAQALLYPDEH